jgi:hypothetical protein
MSRAIFLEGFTWVVRARLGKTSHPSKAASLAVEQPSLAVSIPDTLHPESNASALEEYPSVVQK